MIVFISNTWVSKKVFAKCLIRGSLTGVLNGPARPVIPFFGWLDSILWPDIRFYLPHDRRM